MRTAGARGQGGQVRRVSAGFCWVAAAVLGLPGAALAVLRLLQTDIGTPWIQLLSLFPASLATTTAACAAAVVAVCLRSRFSHAILAAMVTALLLLQLHMVAPSLLPGSAASLPQAAGHAGMPVPGRITTVMALNVGAAGVDAGTVLAEVRARGVDILALPELKPLGLEALEAAGIGAVLPYRAVDVDWAGVGSSIFSRFPLEVSGRVPESSFYQSRAVASVPGVAGGIHLTAVHVASPRPGQIPNWRRELHQLTHLRRESPASSPAILLGDFNASHDHREFRELLAAGLTDAAQASGKGLAPTWPAGSRIPAFVAVDHILVTPDIRVRDFATVAVAGTDHAGVVADLLLPG